MHRYDAVAVHHIHLLASLGDGARQGSGEVKYDPRQPYTLSIPSMADVEPSERPTFTFRRLNGAEYDQLATVSDEDRPTREMHTAIYEAFCVGLIGWRNQVDPATLEEIPFPSVAQRSSEAYEEQAGQLTKAKLEAALRRIITPEEAWQVIGERLKAARLNHHEKKVSA